MTLKPPGLGSIRNLGVWQVVFLDKKVRYTGEIFSP
jgi:hypothetical protein